MLRRGVEAIVSTANSALRGGDDTVESVDRDGNRNLVDAATAAGVRHFVFVSALGASPDSPVPFMRAKGETEQRLRDSGMPWTVLQPNAYMDIWFPMVVGGPALAGQPVTLVGEGRRRHSFVAMRDVAAYAIAALDQEAIGQTLIIGGPEPVTWWDVVAAFNAELGREIPIRTVRPGQPVPGLPGRHGPAAGRDGDVRLASRQQRAGPHLRRHADVSGRVRPRLRRRESSRRHLGLHRPERGCGPAARRAVADRLELVRQWKRGPSALEGKSLDAWTTPRHAPLVVLLGRDATRHPSLVGLAMHAPERRQPPRNFPSTALVACRR